MTEAAWHDNNGMLQSVPWSVGRSLSNITSASCVSPNQPIRHNLKYQSMFLNLPSQAKNCKALKCWRCMFGLATKVHRIFLKLCESSWRLRTVVSRASFRGFLTWKMEQQVPTTITKVKTALLWRWSFIRGSTVFDGGYLRSSQDLLHDYDGPVGSKRTSSFFYT